MSLKHLVSQLYVKFIDCTLLTCIQPLIKLTKTFERFVAIFILLN